MELVSSLNKEKKYLLGVSGGCDSMCLLSLCLYNRLNIVVCHVNYNVRETAIIEENLVNEFCAINNIPFYSYHPKKDVNGNFQAWAREARYGFYKDIYDKEKCDYLLLGHQKDDHLETYLMSLKRGSVGWFYGINIQTYHHGMNICRPLINMRKRETRSFCFNNNIPFHDDESNFTDHYQRNVIRHSLIETASDEQIQEWESDCALLNTQLQNKIAYIENNYDLLGTINIEKYEQESLEARHLILRRMIYKIDENFNPTESQIKQIDNGIISHKNNFYVLRNGWEIVYEYNTLYLHKPNPPYSYTFNKIDYGKYDHFSLKETGEKIQGVDIKPSDYPITIRSYQLGDSIQMKFGTKRVSRVLIDKKIPRKERLNWLVIENKNKEIIFVEKIGCDYKHYSIKPNLFVIK